MVLFYNVLFERVIEVTALPFLLFESNHCSRKDYGNRGSEMDPGG